ncbi:hypothetical protein ES703_32372 [subsurface metagenome]
MKLKSGENNGEMRSQLNMVLLFLAPRNWLKEWQKLQKTFGIK